VHIYQQQSNKNKQTAGLTAVLMIMTVFINVYSACSCAVYVRRYFPLCWDFCWLNISTFSLLLDRLFSLCCTFENESDADAQIAFLKLLTLHVVCAEIETSCCIWWRDMCCCSTVISSSWIVWIQKSTWYQRWQSVSQSEIILHIWVPENQITQYRGTWVQLHNVLYNHPLWLVIWSCI